jgi:hypothetical protein
MEIMVTNELKQQLERKNEDDKDRGISRERKIMVF